MRLPHAVDEVTVEEKTMKGKEERTFSMSIFRFLVFQFKVAETDKVSVLELRLDICIMLLLFSNS